MNEIEQQKAFNVAQPVIQQEADSWEQLVETETKQNQETLIETKQKKETLELQENSNQKCEQLESVSSSWSSGSCKFTSDFDFDEESKQVKVIAYEVLSKTEHTILLPMKITLSGSTKFQHYLTRIPQTAGQVRGISLEPTRIAKDSGNVRFWDPLGYPLVTVFRNIFGEHCEQINEQLIQSTNYMYALKPASKQKPNTRGHPEAEGRCYHFGVWRKYTDNPKCTIDTVAKNGNLLEHFDEWWQTNKVVFDRVNQIFKEHFPLLFAWYDSLSKLLPHKLFGAFATCVLNVDFAVWSHKDPHDCKNGYCFVLEFGDFTGGDLVLEDLKINIECSPGDLVVFPSHLLYHKVENYEGWRSSLVFLSHDTLFFPPAKGYEEDTVGRKHSREETEDEII